LLPVAFLFSHKYGLAMAEWFYEELMLSKTIDPDASACAVDVDGAVQQLRAEEPAPQRWAWFMTK
jgi:hypothetical protein